MPYTSYNWSSLQTLVFNFKRPSFGSYLADDAPPTTDCMTPSPPTSPTSSPSSRPSSSTSNPPFHDNTPRSSTQSGRLPPFRFTTPPGHASTIAVGAAPRIPEASTSSSPEQLRHRRQKSDESIHPRSSSSSPQALEEAAISADPDAGTSVSPSGEPTTTRLKKKRTRTLTTPHQSAVLHALLAQSRFPTTAMREEVGRSIGLSARKVQVWFQNQRQKARKPRNQSTVPLSRPPQFGAFSSGSQSEGVPLAGPSGSSTHFQDIEPLSRQQTYSSEHIHPSGLPAPYPDPQQYPPSDVSGHSSSSSNPSLQYRYPNIGHNLDPGSSSTTRRFSPPFALSHPLSQSSNFTPQAPFPPDPYDRRHSVPGVAPRRGNEPPIMLPPLRFDRPHGAQTLPPPFQLGEPHGGGPDTASHSTPLSTHSRSTSSISPSSTPHFPPSFTLPPPPSRHPEGIPPPFTLQPQPQWGPSAPQISGPGLAIPAQTALSRSSRSSPTVRPRRPRTNSDPARRLPPLSMILQSSHDQPLLTRPPWPQQNPPMNVGASGRRFDPVHSVLREDGGGGAGGHSGQGEGGNPVRGRNRHTYDFTRPSSGATTPPPPNPTDPRGD